MKFLRWGEGVAAARWGAVFLAAGAQAHVVHGEYHKVLFPGRMGFVTYAMQAGLSDGEEDRLLELLAGERILPGGQGPNTFYNLPRLKRELAWAEVFNDVRQAPFDRQMGSKIEWEALGGGVIQYAERFPTHRIFLEPSAQLVRKLPSVGEASPDPSTTKVNVESSITLKVSVPGEILKGEGTNAQGVEERERLAFWVVRPDDPEETQLKVRFRLEARWGHEGPRVEEFRRRVQMARQDYRLVVNKLAGIQESSATVFPGDYPALGLSVEVIPVRAGEKDARWGLRVSEVRPGSPAADQKILGEDLLVDVGGVRVDDEGMEALNRGLRMFESGRELTLSVWRRGELHPKRVIPPEELVASHGWLGISMEIRDGQLMITRVYEGTPAREAQLQEGDRIVLVNRRAIRQTEDFRKVVKGLAEKGLPLDLYIVRAGLPPFTKSIKLPKTPFPLNRFPDELPPVKPDR